MSQLAVEIQERKSNETGKKVRKHGEIPGIVYGEFLKENIPVKVEPRNFYKLLKKSSKGEIIQLKFKHKMAPCVIKQIQKNNITGEVIHVDFQYVKKNEVIKLSIPITYLGCDNLELKRLILTTSFNDIEVEGVVENIPEGIEINVGTLNYDDKILAKDIKLPEGVKLITDPETILAVIGA
ncbi:50S ribosomal protein L25 [Clostridium fallax]|uniref:Large ribosomal subunit protein bL25 n=1 Tax=Clostridium fallax TaxID=1533 RepID=A0A1M4WGE8_9CLOT|nr:50S ribosomal protein L25 [Clostridium fallax]SHE80230.1 large subunit ribosomal protein L25 [Clostridium fallax]SQB04953.1 ribosomal 5S rRNA E-loop binding protein Ctc/L25/TL5 [Clostridium fallax]